MFSVPYVPPSVAVVGAKIGFGKQLEEGADTETALGTVPEQAVRIDRIEVAAADAASGQVTFGLQVSDDGLDCALGEADNVGDVAHTRLGAAGDLYQYVPVPCEQRPLAAGLVRCIHPGEHNIAR